MPRVAPTGGTTARVIKNAESITEWYTHVGGDVEACGEASVAMALHALRNTPTDASFVTQLASEAQQARQVTDYPRVSTSPNNLAWLLKKHGVSSVIHWRDWQSALQANAGSLPVIVGVNNATVFGGHDANVHGHYICVFGVATNGNFVVGDPNTPESTQGAMVYYSLAQMQAADPFASIVPLEDPLASIPVIGGALDALISPVNAQIRHVSGFTGIVELIAQDEQTSAPNIGSIFDIGGYVYTNFRAWLLRTIVILVGLTLILGVLIQTMKQADPGFWNSLNSPAGAADMSALSGGGGMAGGAEGGAVALPAEAAVIA